MSQYVIESDKQIFEQDFINLRRLYLPIIGPLASSLYQHLIDTCKTNAYKTNYKPIESLKITLNMTNEQFISSRKTLEAVGLLQTFTKQDAEIFLFSIAAPLSIDKFIKNGILLNKLKQVIGEVEMERIIYDYKTVSMNKSSFINISAKYHDIFNINEIIEISNTSEIKVPDFKDKDQAIKNASSAMFVRFLTQTKPSPTLMQSILTFKNMGMSNESLNTIINYSYNVNGKIVAKHFETIAYDLFSSDTTSAQDIKRELDNALIKKQRIHVEEPASLETEKGGELSLDVMFSDLFS